jgi:hypothetical protein
MKKGLIAAVIIAGILLLLGGFYWFGYIEFQDNIPTFTLTPGTTQSNTTAEQEETPTLVINAIKGRFNKVSATIKNIGDTDVASVTWSISVEGGILKRIDQRSTGTIALARQSETTIVSERIPFGLGRLEITVTVEATSGEPVTQNAQGFKLLLFVVGVRT